MRGLPLVCLGEGIGALWRGVRRADGNRASIPRDARLIAQCVEAEGIVECQGVVLPDYLRLTNKRRWWQLCRLYRHHTYGNPLAAAVADGECRDRKGDGFTDIVAGDAQCNRVALHTGECYQLLAGCWQVPGDSASRSLYPQRDRLVVDLHLHLVPVDGQVGRTLCIHVYSITDHRILALAATDDIGFAV